MSLIPFTKGFAKHVPISGPISKEKTLQVNKISNLKSNVLKTSNSWFV